MSHDELKTLLSLSIGFLSVLLSFSVTFVAYRLICGKTLEENWLSLGFAPFALALMVFGLFFCVFFVLALVFWVFISMMLGIS